MKSGRALGFIGLVVMLTSVPAVTASVGEIAPDFEVTSKDGSTYRLSDFRDWLPNDGCNVSLNENHQR